MPSFIAHYRSRATDEARASGLFEFESAARAATKANVRDARLRMLDLYGKDAVSWTIDKVERKKASEASQDGQLELDFRPPKPQRKGTRKKEWW